MVDVLKFLTLVVLKKSPRQTMQIQIRLLLKKQSGQGLPCFLLGHCVKHFVNSNPEILEY